MTLFNIHPRKSFAVSVLALFGCAGSAFPDDLREFTATDGRKLKASVVEVSGDRATIRRADGNQFTVSITAFSEADQEFLRAWKPGGSNAPASGDWFQWRGPNRDGVSTETGLKQDWTDDAPEPKT